MKPAFDDLPNRRTAWEALSDLFLDTDTSLSRPWRVQVLAATPYTVEELEQILIWEVEPVCRWNMLGIAGEWFGFDLDRMQRRILGRLRRPMWLRYPSFARFTIPRDSEWITTKAEVNSLRSEGLTSKAPELEDPL